MFWNLKLLKLSLSLWFLKKWHSSALCSLGPLFTKGKNRKAVTWWLLEIPTGPYRRRPRPLVCFSLVISSQDPASDPLCSAQLAPFSLHLPCILNSTQFPMQSRPVLSAFCPLPLNHGSVHMLGEAAPIAATYLLIHLPLESSYASRGQKHSWSASFKAFFFLHSCYSELQLHQRALFKMWQAHRGHLYGNCLPSLPRESSPTETSWKNATVGAFSWESGLKNGQLRRCKESASTPLSRPCNLPCFIYILHPALQLTALFSLFGPRS